MSDEGIRLDRYLSEAETGTRSEVKKLIRKGYVTVNGTAVTAPETKIRKNADKICVKGEEIAPPSDFIYYILNKPAGYLCATEDASGHTVMELLPGSRRSLFPVGRLDKDTEGLLLITDDGALAHALLAPGRHVEKTYFARLDAPVNDRDVRAVAEGIDIGEKKKTLPGRLEILPEPGEICLTICEGKYHQVKRMMAALGKNVLYLKRISMGPLVLSEDLESGCCRLLSEAETEKLLAYKK